MFCVDIGSDFSADQAMVEKYYLQLCLLYKSADFSKRQWNTSAVVLPFDFNLSAHQRKSSALRATWSDYFKAAMFSCMTMTALGHYDDGHNSTPFGTMCFECGQLSAEEGTGPEEIYEVLLDASTGETLRDFFAAFTATRTAKTRMQRLELNRTTVKEALTAEG